jgi:hypothetical protein
VTDSLPLDKRQSGVTIRSALKHLYWFARSRLPARWRVTRRIRNGYEILSEPRYFPGYGWSHSDHNWPAGWAESSEARAIKNALSSPVIIAIPGAWSADREREALDVARAALTVRRRNQPKPTFAETFARLVESQAGHRNG